MYYHFMLLFCTLLIFSNCKKKKQDKEFSIANLLSGMDRNEQLMFKEELEKEVKKFHVPGSHTISKAGIKRSKVKEKIALKKSPNKQTKLTEQKPLVGICDPICAHQCVHGCDFRCCVPGYQAAKHIPRPPITVTLPGACSPICSPTCYPECSPTCCAGGAGGMFQSNSCPYGCSVNCYPSCTMSCCLLEIKKNFPPALSPTVSQVPYYVQPPQPQNYLALNQQNYDTSVPAIHTAALTSPLRNAYSTLYQLPQPRISVFPQKTIILPRVNRYPIQPFAGLPAFPPIPSYQNLCVPACRVVCTPQCPIQCCLNPSRDIETAQLRQNFPIIQRNENPFVCQPMCRNFCQPTCPKRCCSLEKNRASVTNTIPQLHSVGPSILRVNLAHSSLLEHSLFSNLTQLNNIAFQTNKTQNCCDKQEEPHDNDKKSKIAKQLELLK